MFCHATTVTMLALCVIFFMLMHASDLLRPSKARSAGPSRAWFMRHWYLMHAVAHTSSHPPLPRRSLNRFAITTLCLAVACHLPVEAAQLSVGFHHSQAFVHVSRVQGCITGGVTSVS
jgi:hypothetical protein